MYEAKGERASHISLVRARVDNGELIDITDDDAAETPTETAASE
jgi:hypothetical protein